MQKILMRPTIHRKLTRFLCHRSFQAASGFHSGRIKDFCAALEIPFDREVIDWRVTNTSNSGKLRGQVIPYADQRAYTDRLNALFTPAGWTRKYAIHTSAYFERSRDQKLVAKVLVTCELIISQLVSAGSCVADRRGGWPRSFSRSTFSAIC